MIFSASDGGALIRRLPELIKLDPGSGVLANSFIKGYRIQENLLHLVDI